LAGAYGEILKNFSQVVAQLVQGEGEWIHYLHKRYGDKTKSYPKWAQDAKQVMHAYNTQESIACVISLSLID
jgi:hypothetical protein